jgi:hypothetical protein
VKFSAPIFSRPCFPFNISGQFCSPTSAILSVLQQLKSNLGLFIAEVSRSHTHTHTQSVDLYTVAQVANYATQNKHKRQTSIPSVISTHNPNTRATAALLRSSFIENLNNLCSDHKVTFLVQYFMQHYSNVYAIKTLCVLFQCLQNTLNRCGTLVSVQSPI